MKVTIDHDALITQIADAIELGLKRDGWVPHPLFAYERESLDDVRRRFARERANNVVHPIVMDAELDAEEGRAA